MAGNRVAHETQRLRNRGEYVSRRIAVAHPQIERTLDQVGVLYPFEFEFYVPPTGTVRLTLQFLPKIEYRRVIKV